MGQKSVSRSFSWGRFFIKEVAIFFAIMVVLALLWHAELRTTPIAWAQALLQSSSVSVWHPFIWSGILYFIAATIRAILAFIRKLQSRQAA